MRKWDIDLKCEECGKHKNFKFWNDGIKLSVMGETNGTETASWKEQKNDGS